MEMRCEWCRGDPIYLEYHDTEWGVPVHDDRKLYEFLVLDAMQAGLSWLTILRKRHNFRKAFGGFDPAKVALFRPKKVDALMSDPGIIRNRLKIESAVNNARAFLHIQREFGSFDAYIWRFVGGTTKRNAWKTLKEIPPKTAESIAMSKDLIKRGFTFVGPTICYAFMQAAGLVNDHTIYCFRYDEIKQH